jgi:hypothetical protein
MFNLYYTFHVLTVFKNINECFDVEDVKVLGIVL